MPDRDVLVQRQRLREELRNRRKLAHRTQKQVARAMDWSPSKMLRIETGAIGISTTDLRALLTYYDVKDQRAAEELVELARAARARRARGK
jgi:transcriptional regulator with XRE-family HTH domain